MLFLPELALLTTGLIFFVLSLTTPGKDKLHGAAILSAVVVLVSSLFSLHETGMLFYDSYSVTLYSQLFKLILAVAALLVLIIGRSFPNIKDNIRAEYYLFFFLSLLGLTMLVSSVEFLAILISLELSSFTTYLMVAMRADGNDSSPHNEAAIKYLLYGVMATGFMLFGMSYLFGLTGSTHLAEIQSNLPALVGQPTTMISLALVISGFFYKLAIFPFQFWVPDVYEGGADETTAFVATLPKIAAVAVLIRLTTLIDTHSSVMVNLLLGVALLSMFYGNFSALVQKDIKRLLGFSGIAHAGFILLGVLLFNHAGYTSAIYYVIGYALMNLTCFFTICSISENNKNLEISDFIGLHKRSPLLATTFAAGLFALAGIPPFIGFTGKFMLLAGALKAGFLIPVIFAALNTALALYYYLSVVRVSFCTDTTFEPQKLLMPIGHKILCLFFITTLLFIGLFPTKLLDLIGLALTTL